MKESKLRYLVLNGTRCIDELEALAWECEDVSERNRLLNHALSVRTLIVELESLNSLYKTAAENLRSATVKVRDYENGLYDKYISEKVEEIKNGLIDHISEFGRW